MKKNPLYFLFVLLLMFALAACGGNDSEPTSTSSNDTGSSSEEASDGNEASGEAELDYPTKDIQVFVGHGAGGGTDTFVRTITKLLEEDLGINFNVINMEGAGGVIAKENGANEPADGYTIVASSALPVQVAIGTNTDAHLNVYKAIARIQSDTLAIQVKAGTFETIDDFMAAAEANPGQIRVGGTGVGTIDDMVFNMFKSATGLDMIFVPFEGAGAMHAALLGGHIDAMMEEPGPVISQIEAGEVQPLMFFTDDRIQEFPDIPTSVEKGWDITNGVERSLLIHKDTPQEIVDFLEAALKRAYDSDEYKEYEKKSYLHLREGWMGSEDYTKKLQADIDAFTEIVANLER